MIGMLMQPETFSVEDLRRQLRESPGFSRGEEINGLKGSSNTEREKALDDISGALEVVTHHILDIMQESK